MKKAEMAGCKQGVIVLITEKKKFQCCITESPASFYPPPSQC